MLSDSGKACQRTTLNHQVQGVSKPDVTQRLLQAAKRMLESPAPNKGRSWAHGEREFSTGVEKTVENKGFL